MSSLNMSSPIRTGGRLTDEDLRDAQEAFCDAECMELYKAVRPGPEQQSPLANI